MSLLEARMHLDLAYRSIREQAPESSTLSLLLAHWALETGRGQNMWGFNFGGIKAGSGGAALGTRESFGTSERRQVLRFRTYRNAVEGARDYISTLAADFPSAFAALQSGSAKDFVRALLDEGYFTGDPVKYARAIELLATEYEQYWFREVVVRN